MHTFGHIVLRNFDSISLSPAQDDVFLVDLGSEAFEIQDEVAPHILVDLHMNLVTPMLGGLQVVHERGDVSAWFLVRAQTKAKGLTSLVYIPKMLQHLEK